MNDENEFIQEIIIKEDYLPFSSWDIVPLWGSDEIQKLIRIYLETKIDSDNNKKNANRFKINCILSNNGWWKSRLFNYILDKKEKEEEVYKDYEIYLDDFFAIWSNFKSGKNLNKTLITGYNYYTLDNSYIYNKPLLISYLIDKKKYISIDLLNIFLDNKIKSKKINLNKWWNKNNLTYIFREDFLYWNIKNNKNDSKKELKINNINYNWNISKLFHGMRKDDFESYTNVLISVRKKLEFKKDNRYNLVLNFIIDRILFSEYRNNIIITDEIKNLNAANLNLYKKNLITFSHDDSEFDIELFLDEILKLNLSLDIETSFIEFIASNVFYIINVEFNQNKNYKFHYLSAWEQLSFLRFINIYSEIYLQYTIEKKLNYIILIDEPDQHLHLDWQKKYISKLIDIFSTLPLDINLHFILATHSPFIISDLPQESIILLDKSETNKHKWEFTEIKKYPKKSFWANFIDIINDWFFFDDKVLMWSFAEDIISKIAEEERKKVLEKDNNFEQIKFLKDEIWDNFLKNNLLYFKWKNENNN